MKAKFTIIFLIFIFFNLFFISHNLAVTIYFRDGRVFQGRLLDETDEHITIEEPGTLWKIFAWKKDVQKIIYDEEEADEFIDIDNAASIYKTAVSKMSGLPRGFEKKALEVLQKGWPQADSRLRKILDDNKEAIKGFKKATTIEKCDFSFGKPLRQIFKFKMPAYNDELNLARLVLLEAKLREKENQLGTALNNYLSVLKFSNHLKQQDYFPAHSARAGVIAQDLSCLPLGHYINREELNTHDFRYIFKNLVGLEEESENIQAILAKDKVSFKKIAGIICQDLTAAAGLNNVFYEDFYQEVDRLSNEYFEDMIVAAQQCRLEECGEKVGRLAKETGIKTGGLSWGKIRNIIKKYEAKNSPSLAARTMVLLAISDYPEIVLKYYIARVKSNILITAAAIKEYRIEKGAYPDSLVELLPDYFSNLPQDPFNNFHPFQYKKQKDNFLLYGAGPDGRVDLSQPGDGDIAFK